MLKDAVVRELDFVSSLQVLVPDSCIIKVRPSGLIKI